MNMLASKSKHFNELPTNYIIIAVVSNDSLSVMVAHKSTKTESQCYQLVDLIRETIDLLKVELKGKQEAMYYSVSELLQIDQFSYRFQKLKD